MLYKGSMITDMSGSLGGITASRGRGGKYFRERVVPVNPNSPEQQAIKAFFSQLSGLWSQTLTQAQRDAWDVFAANTPVTNPLGDVHFLTGLNQYVKSNVPRLQASQTRIDTAPPLFGGAVYTPPTVDNATVAGQTFDVNFTVGDPWVGTDDAALIAWASPPQNPGINFYKGPYRFAGVVEGDSVTPPTSPASIAAPFAFTLGQRIFVRLNLSEANGNLGADTRFTTIAVA